MNTRTEINVYRFSQWSGEYIDPEWDVESELGGFTWRVNGQSIPKVLKAIRLHATIEELSHIDTLANDIARSFPWEVRIAEVTRIATDLVAKISQAILASPDAQFEYIHSERHAAIVDLNHRRKVALENEPLAPWELELLQGRATQ